jgi:putative flippase GtrA
VICITKLIDRSFIRFLAVGSFGFVVDAGLTLALQELADFAPWFARIPSFVVATIITFQANRTWTFAASHLPWLKSYGYYLAASLVGLNLNYAAFLAITWGQQNNDAMHSLIGVAVGSVLGLALNFFISRFMIFRR